MNNMGRNFILWLIIGVIILTLFNLFQTSSTQPGQTSLIYSDFISQVQNGQISDVTIKGGTVTGHFNDSKPFITVLPHNVDITDKLMSNNVKISVKEDDSNSPTFLSFILTSLPMLLLIGVWIFFMRQMQGGGGKAMGFGKSRAKLLTEKTGKVTFEDVAGVDEAKTELEEVVEFLKDPQKFQRLGGKIPKGVLLVGPPGTGKTLIARAVAGEANVPFFTISGSDFVEMFVGVGASRVRDMFEQGKKNAPCIIFIDEIDAVGRHRGAGLGGGNDEREQTLNQLLVEMDGFEANEGVILIAATNRPDVLDPALLRPGRFDRQVVVPNPDVLGREKILRVHMRKIPLSDNVDPRIIARGTPGFSGADLMNLVNEAALLAARGGKKYVDMDDLESAKDKVMMGAERRSMVMTEQEKKLTAYHEAGHALVSLYKKHSDPIHKATIIPRGRALGMVMRLPEDRVSMSRAKLMADLAVAMGGRIAEEVIFGEDMITTGASSDIQQATNIAKHMVTEWGMSEKMGMIKYGDNSQEVFLGHSVTQTKSISDKTAEMVDGEVRRIVDESYLDAKTIITKHIDQLHEIALALIEYETLTGDEIRDLMAGNGITRTDLKVPEYKKLDTKSKSSVPTSELPKSPPKARKPKALKESEATVFDAKPS